MKKRGYFLALEGPDGSGKSTIARLLKEELKKEGQVLLTREPGGSQIGEDIRRILLSPKNREMAARTEAFLYAAARNQHVVQVIGPALELDQIVICDRFLFSSLAYQGYARKLGIERVKKINDYALEGLYPDRIIFFDLDPQEGLRRNVDQGKTDRLEDEGLDFHQRVYEGYRQAIEKYPDRVAIIDGGQGIDQVLDDCMKIIREDLK